MKIEVDAPSYAQEVATMVERMREAIGVGYELGPDDTEWRVGFNAAMGLTCELARQGRMRSQAFLSIMTEYVNCVITGKGGFGYTFLTQEERPCKDDKK